MPPLLLPDPIVSEPAEPFPWFADDPAPDGLLPAVPIFEFDDPMLEPDVPMLEPEADGDDVGDDEEGEVLLPDVPLLIPLPAVLPEVEVEPEPIVPEPDDWAKAAPLKPSAITAAVVRRRRFIDDLSSLTFVFAAGLPASKTL